MKVKEMLRNASMMGALLFLYACGGGGGAKAPDTVLKGVAQAGVFNGATVKVYGYDGSGNLGQLTTSPGTITTDGTGNYSANLGSYTGAVVVKVFGTFHDEASDTDITVPEGSALRGAVANASGTINLPVTVLTDVAVRKAETAGSIKDNISGANASVSAVFGFDIISTTPVAPTVTALSTTGVNGDQKKYTTALTTLSQYVANISSTPAAPSVTDLTTALSQISSGISGSGSSSVIYSPLVALNLRQAASDVTGNVNTKATVSAAGSAGASVVSSLTTIGNTTGNKILAVKFKTTGTFTSGTITGVTAYVTVPTGATVRMDQDGVVVLGVVVGSGTAAGDSALPPLGALLSGVLTVTISPVHDIAIGEFATVYFDVPVGSSLSAADFPVTGDVVYKLDVQNQSLTSRNWPMSAF